MARRWLFAIALTGCGTGADVPSDASPDSGIDAPGMDAAVDQDAGDDVFAGMLLARKGSSLVRQNGMAVDFRGAISCCGGGMGWPLFDSAWVDFTAGYQTTFLHMRLGPFLTGAGGETDWASIGGGYVETSGKADLASFNPKFWSEVRTRIERAGKKGMWVEVDVADGWAIKHCRAGDLPGYSAWDPAFNAQAKDECAVAGSGALVQGTPRDAWVRKVFQETARYGNVIYEEGNEIGLVPGYQTAWTVSLEAALRSVESANGFPHHLFGTQSGAMATIQHASVEYVELHQDTAAMPSQCAGKPCLVNEYNPNPSLTPAQLHQQFCAARASGTYFWYWRHGQTDMEMSSTLALLAGGC